MDFMMANDILKKYELYKVANAEFRRKTLRDTGKMNVGLRLRICADHLSRKARELEKEREKIIKGNNEKCPNFEVALKNNPFAHEDCWFLCMIPENFCYTCQFYIDNIRDIDTSIQELYDAAECFRDEANYDDTWQ